LANGKKKQIKLYQGQDRLLDRFSVELFADKEGQSLLRRNPRGLDGASNYCYADEAYAPTPGRTNGPCATDNSST
jgi:hypothetical protein